jgi:hypothetical protein
MHVVENKIYFEVQFDEKTENIVWADIFSSTINRLNEIGKLNLSSKKITNNTSKELGIICFDNEKSIILCDHERIVYIGNEDIFKTIFNPIYDIENNRMDMKLYNGSKNIQVTFNPSLIIKEYYKTFHIKGQNNYSTSEYLNKYLTTIWECPIEKVVFTENLLGDIAYSKRSSDMIRWFDDGSLLVKDTQGRVWVIAGNIVVYIGYFQDIDELPCISFVEYDELDDIEDVPSIKEKTNSFNIIIEDYQYDLI